MLYYLFIIVHVNSVLTSAMLLQIQFCHDYAFVGGHNWPKFGSGRHKNILVNRAHSLVLLVIVTLLSWIFGAQSLRAISGVIDHRHIKP